jgi:hypothetical protein
MEETPTIEEPTVGPSDAAIVDSEAPARRRRRWRRWLIAGVVGVLVIIGSAVAIHLNNQPPDTSTWAGHHGPDAYVPDRPNVYVDLGTRETGNPNYAKATVTWFAGPTETKANVSLYADGVAQVFGAQKSPTLTCYTSPSSYHDCTAWVPAKASVKYTAVVSPVNT